ncbi:uncharacterized [Tachysurus ichikawai]
MDRFPTLPGSRPAPTGGWNNLLETLNSFNSNSDVIQYFLTIAVGSKSPNPTPGLPIPLQVSQSHSRSPNPTLGLPIPL